MTHMTHIDADSVRHVRSLRLCAQGSRRNAECACDRGHLGAGAAASERCGSRRKGHQRKHLTSVRLPCESCAQAKSAAAHRL